MRLPSPGEMMRRFLLLLHYRTVAPFAAVFTAVMLVVFWDVLPYWITTTSPDDSPFYAANYSVAQIEALLADKNVFMWQRFLNICAPILCHEFAYAACVFLLGLSGAYYLRTQRISRVAACGGGLFLALSGYLFTLFSAGHLGFFYLIAAVFWSLGLLSRCFESRNLWHFALLGCVLMWGQPGQPDVWILAVAVIAAYALWRTILVWRAGPGAMKAIGRVYVRFLLTGVVAALLGVVGIRQVFGQHLAGRDKQIADSSRTEAQTVTNGQGDEQQRLKARDRWLFATGWSLPPEDCAEFIVPGIFGNDSFRPPYPYWGRLGQHHDFQPGRMMPNYRQHTVYLGLVPLLLAVFAVCAWVVGRKRKQAVNPQAYSADSRPQAADCSDVPFWTAVWIVSLLLAMGRYTPFYRAFYAIPYMDYLRAPVKFLHFAEVATALLAGFGLESLVSGRASLRLQRGFVLGIFVLAAALGLAAALFAANGADVETHIAQLGLGQVAKALNGYAVYNCLRAAGLAAVAAALFWWARGRSAKGRAVAVVVATLVILGVSDQALVARRYVIPMDVKPFHAENTVIRAMRARTGGRPANVANYVTRNVWGQDWFSTALGVHAFPNQIPDMSDANAAQRPFLLSFQTDPLRFWQVMGVRFVILGRQQAEPLVRQQVLAPVCEFEIGAGTVRQTQGSGSALLCELPDGGLPKVYFEWAGGIAKENQVATVVETGGRQPVTDAPEHSAPASRPPQRISLSRSRGERGVYVTRVELELAHPGLLVWPERYSPDLVAFLDGVATPLYQANGFWCAVRVPDGKHALAIRMYRRPIWNAVMAGVSVCVVLGAAACWRPCGNRGRWAGPEL